MEEEDLTIDMAGDVMAVVEVQPVVFGLPSFALVPCGGSP